MVGGERLELIDSKVDPLNVDGRPAWIDTEKVKRDFEALRKSLRVHKTVLVGHNLFLDLINFYRCFFGTLPDTVEEFQTKIHELFPLVIDTKYMASALHEGPLVRSGLDELDAALGKMKQPIISKSAPYFNNRSCLADWNYQFWTRAIYVMSTIDILTKLDSTATSLRSC